MEKLSPVIPTLGQTRAGLSFVDCVMKASEHAELVSNFERLYGVKIVELRTPIQMLVDKACNREPDTDGMRAFVDFVYDCVWLRFAPLDEAA